MALVQADTPFYMHSTYGELIQTVWRLCFQLKFQFLSRLASFIWDLYNQNTSRKLAPSRSNPILHMAALLDEIAIERFGTSLALCVAGCITIYNNYIVRCTTQVFYQFLQSFVTDLLLSHSMELIKNWGYTLVYTLPFFYPVSIWSVSANLVAWKLWWGSSASEA